MRESLLIGAEVAVDARQNLAEKVTFMAHERGIDPSRIYNIDETSVRIVPQQSQGYFKRGRDESAAEAALVAKSVENKISVTVTPMWCLEQNQESFAQGVDQPRHSDVRPLRGRKNRNKVL